MGKYIGTHHRITFIAYHLIFSTKYRRKCFVEIEEQVQNCFKEVEAHSKFKIKYLGIDKDHIHLLVTSDTNTTIGSIVRRLKMLSTYILYRDCENHLRKFYWKQKKLLWTHGYFCSTIGCVSEENIKKYIENQGKD